MKLMIVGSRSIKNFDLSPYISKDVDTVISGGATGVDSLAEQYADSHRISKYILRPRYDLYGRAAPLKRNEQMVDMADAVLIIWDGYSKGTQYTLKYTKKVNKPIMLVNLNGDPCGLL
ncbi:MAG: hypothetical protein E7637_05090 [Ruminococcaceae bacterium]|nr:hypothetical protein [Oscillospiraceae bacterium]